MCLFCLHIIDAHSVACLYLLLQTYKHGETFGELALMYNAPRAASIKVRKVCNIVISFANCYRPEVTCIRCDRAMLWTFTRLISICMRVVSKALPVSNTTSHRLNRPKVAITSFRAILMSYFS